MFSVLKCRVTGDLVSFEQRTPWCGMVCVDSPSETKKRKGVSVLRQDLLAILQSPS